MAGTWNVQITGRTLWEIRTGAREEFRKFLGVDPGKVRFIEQDGHDFVHCNKPELDGEMVFDVREGDTTVSARYRNLLVADVTVAW